MDARRFIKQMREHCEGGMKVPTGSSAKEVLANKEKLLRVVSCMREDSLEFKSQLEEFSRNIEEFKFYHELIPKEEPCVAERERARN